MTITLDSLTSDFNIATDITRDVEFNNMVGFSKEEIIEMMNEKNGILYLPLYMACLL